MIFDDSLGEMRITDSDIKKVFHQLLVGDSHILQWLQADCIITVCSASLVSDRKTCSMYDIDHISGSTTISSERVAATFSFLSEKIPSGARVVFAGDKGAADSAFVFSGIFGRKVDELLLTNPQWMDSGNTKRMFEMFCGDVENNFLPTLSVTIAYDANYSINADIDRLFALRNQQLDQAHLYYDFTDESRRKTFCGRIDTWCPSRNTVDFYSYRQLVLDCTRERVFAVSWSGSAVNWDELDLPAGEQLDSIRTSAENDLWKTLSDDLKKFKDALLRQ